MTVLCKKKKNVNMGSNAQNYQMEVVTPMGWVKGAVASARGEGYRGGNMLFLFTMIVLGHLNFAWSIPSIINVMVEFAASTLM